MPLSRLKRTLGEPTIVQMSSTAPLLSVQFTQYQTTNWQNLNCSHFISHFICSCFISAATAKSNVDQRHIAGYSGHVPNREKAAAEPRPRAWFYDVSTANLWDCQLGCQRFHSSKLCNRVCISLPQISRDIVTDYHICMSIKTSWMKHNLLSSVKETYYCSMELCHRGRHQHCELTSNKR